MEWLRIYHEARNDAKLRTLTDGQFRVWFNLLLLASEQEDRGLISEYDTELLAVEVANGDEELLGNSLSRLERLRIVVVTPCNAVKRDPGVTGVTYISIEFIKFLDRQYDKTSDRPDRVRQRVAKYRETRKPDVVTPSNAPVTPSNPLKQSRTEQNRAEAEQSAAPGQDNMPSQIQADIALFGLVKQSARDLLGKELPKAHVNKLQAWFTEYKRKLTAEVIKYAEEQTAGHTDGKNLDYFVEVMRRKIEEPHRDKPPRGSANGHGPPVDLAHAAMPPPGYSWDTHSDGRWKRQIDGVTGELAYGYATLEQVEERDRQEKAKYLAGKRSRGP